jgi:hypothetical protein
VVIGRIDNPVKDRQGQNKYLVVGQFVAASVEADPGPDLVEIPASALNEVDGDNLVFVQPDPRKPEFRLRRVVVVRSSKDAALVRSKLTPEDRKRFAKDELEDSRPLGTLQAADPEHGVRGDWVVIHGMPEMTEAFLELEAKARTEQK